MISHAVHVHQLMHVLGQSDGGDMLVFTAYYMHMMQVCCACRLHLRGAAVRVWASTMVS